MSLPRSRGSTCARRSFSEGVLQGMEFLGAKPSIVGNSSVCSIAVAMRSLLLTP